MIKNVLIRCAVGLVCGLLLDIASPSTAKAEAPCLTSPARVFDIQNLSASLQVVAAVESDSAQESPASQWADTSLRFDTLKKYVNDADCKDSQTLFIACIEALDGVAAFAQPERKRDWVPLEFYKAHPEYFEKIDESEEPLVFAVYKPLSSFDPDPRKAKVIQTKIQKQVIVALADFYTNSFPPKVPFSKMLNDGYRKFVAPAPSREAEIAGNALNRYLGTKLDPHTYVVPKKMLESWSKSSNPYAGVGIEAKPVPDGFLIYPAYASPAVRAGLRTGDIITAIDGVSVRGLSPEEISKRSRGEPGTQVKFHLKRGTKELDISVKRETISNNAVESHLVKDGDATYGYIQLNHFTTGRSACSAIENTVELFEEEGASGLILDLRNNGGGDASAAACITSIFVGNDRTIAETHDLEGHVTGTFVEPARHHTLLPLVTLVNESSASASEITSGALQEAYRSYIVGNRTFGKGTFQNVAPYSELKNMYLARTAGTYHFASGRTPQLVGIQPDFKALSLPDIHEDDEPGAIREEDLYSNAIQPPPNPPFESRRKDQIQKIQSCMSKTGRAQQEFTQGSADPLTPSDYQLGVAKDVLRCSLN